MATTTKTLTPTNQTITLPDMTERPNASVLVDGIGKDADAINALSEQIANKIKFMDVEITPGSAGECSLSDITGISTDTILSVVVKDYNNAVADLYTYSNSPYVRVHTRNDYATPVTSQVTLRIVYRGN